ncbi:uncharacterized protein K489DRAFT_320963 [Dissoconium aciculare CBS 342.82]|uniref:DNA-directed RNA polymerase subunit n=1 Tax=Dissoconium aciculare CBS 342.82 TaxID=1314786 RepID=A0A6J3M3Q3_9PEZI|nr:uncharacterized protein K489DRAFT_320963 [Dissoconium aciculare CBS 342.82]KAF1822533.1 hypothetical protein K489DRAFT_320963 [Dissoconium aciculare CBS 342.82]
MDNYDVEDPAAAIVKDTGKVAFRFCPECSNMLQPHEDAATETLVFECSTCHHIEKSLTACIYRNSLKEDIAETPGNVDDVLEDPTLPWTDEVECKKCKHHGAVFFQSQQRNAETGMALFYVCEGCKHVWSTLDDSKK